MLPCVDTEDGLDVNSSGSKVLLVRGVGAHCTSVLVAEGSVGGVRSHIHRLSSRVGCWVWRSRVVCAEDVEETFPFEVLSQPDKAGTEHGVGGREEIELEGFDGGASVDDVLGELIWDFGASRGL